MATTAALAGLEAVMWSLEDDPRTRSGVAGVLVVDSPPDMAALRARLAELVASNPRLRSTVTAQPRPLAPYRWHERAQIDLDDRLSSGSALDTRGGLLQIVADMMEAPYSTGDLLWDVKVVGDLPGGAAAIVVRLNHCLTDGLGAMALAASFFDLDEVGTRVAPPAGKPADPGPAADGGVGRWTLAADSVADDARFVRGLARGLVGNPFPTVSAVVRQPVGTVRRGGAYTASAIRLLRPAPSQLSPSLKQHSGRTRIHTLELSLADMKKAAKSLDASINDIFMTGLSRGLHSYHVALGQDATVVRASMAINSRSGKQNSAGGNHFVPVRIQLPLTSGDVARSVHSVQEHAARAKAEAALGIAPYVSEVLGRLPGRVSALAAQGMYHGVDIAASNFPGPPIPLWVAGSRVRDFFAVGPRAGGAVSATLISYDGTAFIALNMDAGAVEHPHLLESCLDDAFRDLTAGVGAGAVARAVAAPA